jgi:cytochrome c oxidase assembly protein subunit 15
VHVESTRLGRLRALEVTPRLFRGTAVAALVAIYVVVTTGAVVRLTASGLGCDNWPRCGNTPFPEKGGHAFIEFGNRVVALVTIGFTLAAWLAARRVPGLSRRMQLLALAMFVGNLAQIPLGGLTVVFHLHPLLVMVHFLLALLVLGAAVVLAIEAETLERGGASPVLPRELRWAGLALLAAAFVLIVTGAFATAAGPHPGGSDVHRLGSPLRSVYVHAGATAVFGCAFLLLLGNLAARRREVPGIFAAALGLAALLAAQVIVGETQYHTDLPWGLVLAHVSLAAAVWAATVGLARLLWRPPASFVHPAHVD